MGTDLRGLAVLLLSLVALPAWGAGGVGAGWRIDGTAVVADATPPTRWTTAETRWSVPLAAESHASPVRWGDHVCVLEEPDAVACFDADTGALAWRVHHPVASALSGAARDAYVAGEARAAALEAELATAQRDHSRLLRDARRAPSDPAVGAALEAGSKRLDELSAAFREASAHRTVLVAKIGFAAATPTLGDGLLYALFGQGVVAAMRPDGTVAWRRWLGAEAPEMRGYRSGHSASPRWIDGVLVVAHGDLMGLSATTGEELWRAGAYRDYGTPEVGHVGDLAVVLTPDGRLVGAADGRTLAEGLGDLWYQGPLLHDGVAYYVGTKAYAPGDGPITATAWRLTPDGDGVRAEALWTNRLSLTDRVYATPVVAGDRLVVATAVGRVLGIDRATGEATDPVAIELPIPGTVYASPIVAGDTVFVSFDHGVHVGLDPATLDEGHRSVLARGLATPWFDGRRVYVRTVASLTCFEAATP